MKSLLREYSKGAVIFKEGDQGNAAYILTEGSIEISVQQAEKRSVLAVVKPVAVFGEMALLLKDQRRTATAIAKTASKVAEICKRDFDDFVEQAPKLVNAVLNALVERLQKTTNMVSRAPDLFLAVGHIIHLLLLHTARGARFDSTLGMIKFDHLVEHIAHALLVEHVEVSRVLNDMEVLNLLEIRVEATTKYVGVPKKNDFLERCHKIHETVTKLSTPKED